MVEMLEVVPVVQSMLLEHVKVKSAKMVMLAVAEVLAMVSLSRSPLVLQSMV